MRRIFCFIFFISYFYDAHAQNNIVGHPNYNVQIKIPSEWIAKIRALDYTRNNKELLIDFENFIKPDTIANLHAQHVDEDYGRVLNTMFVDLDGEPGDELICLLGWDISSPSLCVFKEKQGSWYLIYLEEIDTFYNSPTLSVANNYSRNKTFYLRRVYEHGSGIYIDGYSFYKVIDNKVYECLNLVNEAHIYGWGLYMNQAVNMHFEFSGDDNDAIDVNYTYNFFPGAIHKKDCSWCANEDISIVKGEGGVNYKWDDKLHTYNLNILSFQNGIDDLTAQKISCFGAFGNDTLFVSAFRGQIDDVLKNGSSQKRKILKKYLELIKKDQTAITEKLKVTRQIGGTTFYGSDKE